MAKFIALLRGINVSGQKPVKMEALRASFEALGFREVETYIQSGNVVFSMAKGDAAGATKKIEGMMREDFGYEVPALVKAAEEMAAVVKYNPLAKLKGIDVARLHVTFLAGEAPKNAEELIAPLVAKVERVQVRGSEVYLYCPGGYGVSKLSNTAIEKKLGLRATTRNWKTVQVLAEMGRKTG